MSVMIDTKNFFNYNPPHEFKDYKELEKWGKKEFKTWFENLSSKEKSIINEYADEYHRLHQLSWYLTHERYKVKVNEEMEQKIILLDQILKKIKTPHHITLYEFPDPIQIGDLTENISLEIWDSKNSSQISQQFFQAIRVKWADVIKKRYDYLLGQFTKDFTDNHKLKKPVFLIEYQVPQGTHGAYWKYTDLLQRVQQKMILARDIEIKFNNFKIINLNQQNLILISAKILTSFKI